MFPHCLVGFIVCCSKREGKGQFRKCLWKTTVSWHASHHLKTNISIHVCVCAANLLISDLYSRVMCFVISSAVLIWLDLCLRSYHLRESVSSDFPAQIKVTWMQSSSTHIYLYSLCTDLWHSLYGGTAGVFHSAWTYYCPLLIFTVSILSQLHTVMLMFNWWLPGSLKTPIFIYQC